MFRPSTWHHNNGGSKACRYLFIFVYLWSVIWISLEGRYLAVQARAVLRGHGSDAVVWRWVGPDDVEAAARVWRRVGITESINDIGEGIVFPADEDVAGARVVVNGAGNTVRVVTVAVGATICISWSYKIAILFYLLDSQAKRLSERLNGLVRTNTRAVCGRGQ
jgi:hypothetical protein